MKKYTKLIMLVAFLCSALLSSAQTKKHVSKKERTSKAQAIEKEIQQFIIDNSARYQLTPEKINELSKISGNNPEKLQQLQVGSKGIELRKLYFKQNPASREFFTAEEDTITVHYICDNGDFEEGYTDEYAFLYNALSLSEVNNCIIDISSSTAASPSTTINDFSAAITLVDDDVSVSGGYEPILHALPVPVNIQRVNSGGKAIRLNDGVGNYGVATMSKSFAVSSDQISFSYLFIATDSSDPANVKPHFTATVYDASNAIVDQFCIYADAANTALFDTTYDSNSTPYVYTGWQCQTLSLKGKKPGQQLRLVFSVNDAFNRGMNFGTVYLDDICDGSGSCSPSPGNVSLDVTNYNCNPLPLKICGNYQLPYTTNTDPVISGTLDLLTFNIYAVGNSTPVYTTNTTYSLSDGVFCFEVDEANLGTPLGSYYEFEVIAAYTLAGYSYTITDTSSNADIDLDLSDCYDDCPECPSVTTNVSGTLDEEEAKFCIHAYNSIDGTSGSSALYHAGQEVVLYSGFSALPGSTDHFYIDGCSHLYVARPAKIIQPQTSEEPTIDLIEKVTAASTLAVYPNPASSEINIVADDKVTITKVSLYSIDGRLVYEGSPTGRVSEYKVSVANASAGIYMLTVQTSDGTTTSQKIIKN